MRRISCLAALAALLCAAFAAPAGAAEKPKRQGPAQLAAPAGPLGHSGRWLTDRTGRAVILHGFNMVYKRPPYTPSTTGFGADDAEFLKRHGFNTIRLGLIYAGVEPQPGVYDDAYIAHLARTERQLAKQGVFSQIDFHQDLYNERFEGEGWPDWAVQDDGLPAEPKSGFPNNYLLMPALSRAFDNFWENSPGPEGVGLQDRYAAAWAHVARAFRGRPLMMGYDLMNEPWPGSAYPECISATGCPGFDGGVFRRFYERVIPAIRAEDQRSLVWYEPNVIFNFGSPTRVGKLADRRLGFSFHDYCLSPAPGVPGGGPGCETSERLTFQNADAHADEAGVPLLLSEFGATDDEVTLERIAGFADEFMASWQEWHYCGCDDPTTTGPGDKQAIVIDPAKPPRGDNVKQAKLRILVRPYPQAIAGTPQGFSFDRDTKRFELAYTKVKPSGKGSFRRGLTDVFIPKLHYAGGYTATVKGAKILSKPDRQHLILRSYAKAKRVSVVVTPR